MTKNQVTHYWIKSKSGKPLKKFAFVKPPFSNANKSFLLARNSYKIFIFFLYLDHIEYLVNWQIANCQIT